MTHRIALDRQHSPANSGGRRDLAWLKDTMRAEVMAARTARGTVTQGDLIAAHLSAVCGYLSDQGFPGDAIGPLRDFQVAIKASRNGQSLAAVLSSSAASWMAAVKLSV